jgi:hypothetical protein
MIAPLPRDGAQPSRRRAVGAAGGDDVEIIAQERHRMSGGRRALEEPGTDRTEVDGSRSQPRCELEAGRPGARLHPQAAPPEPGFTHFASCGRGRVCGRLSGPGERGGLVSIRPAEEQRSGGEKGGTGAAGCRHRGRDGSRHSGGRSGLVQGHPVRAARRPARCGGVHRNQSSRGAAFVTRRSSGPMLCSSPRRARKTGRCRRIACT